MIYCSRTCKTHMDLSKNNQPPQLQIYPHSSFGAIFWHIPACIDQPVFLIVEESNGNL